jgi:hypothetical protein
MTSPVTGSRAKSTDVNTEQKRQWLLAQYPNSKTWPDRVKKMPDAQVIAIYLKMQQRPKERAS